MAIAIDASTPARWTGTPADSVDITSASFTAPANSVLVLCASSDTDAVASATTLSASDSGGLTWTERAHRDDTDSGLMGGCASVWTAVQVTSAARTVSLRRTTGNGGTNRLSAKLYVVTGADTTTPTGAVGELQSATNNLSAAIFTSTVANSFAFVAGTEWNQLGSPVSSDLTEDSADYSGALSCTSGYKDCGATGAETANLDAGGTGTAAWTWGAVEILPGSAVAALLSKSIVRSQAINRASNY